MWPLKINPEMLKYNKIFTKTNSALYFNYFQKTKGTETRKCEIYRKEVGLKASPMSFLHGDYNGFTNITGGIKLRKVLG